ncbi:class I SAM-dependent methyltransferase [uncultured Desulfuromonas sp.]|uniref:class I SAM-dependent methyltransferase n=1 Tax=uncultured Desulfuromonas sp. TaxID=181013 RepID=UPI002AAB3B52|nr:class I SAM-dependent methyltransferase [uncultured Desulfuromonas sp.]
MQPLSPLLTEVQHHLPANGESRRLFYGRGQCFAGYDDVVIDYHPHLILICLYRQRDASWLEAIAAELRELIVDARCVVVQFRYQQGCPVRVVSGDPPDHPEALEDGLRYHLQLDRGQNLGFFPDMAFGRRLVRQRAQGKKVLNLFAYTCSFSIAALAGGARNVCNVDMSRSALELGRANHQLNGYDLRDASFVAVEVFRSNSRMRKLAPFDLIVCDPPAQQGRSFTAQTHWPKLLQRLPNWVVPGGELVLCLNGPHVEESFLEDLIAAYLPCAERLGCLDSGEDFPEKKTHCKTRLYHLRYHP